MFIEVHVYKVCTLVCIEYRKGIVIGISFFNMTLKIFMLEVQDLLKNILLNSSIKSTIIVALFPPVIFAKNIQGYISSFQKVHRGDSSNFASTFATQVQGAVLLF